MTKKEYTPLPDCYPVCEHVDCPLASTCLHQIAYPTLMEQEEYLADWVSLYGADLVYLLDDLMASIGKNRGVA